MKKSMMGRKAWMFMAFFAFMATFAFAQTVTPPAAAAAAPTTSTVASILLAALNGGIIGLVGWLSQRKQDDGTHEKLDPVQIVVTIVVGALIGAIAAWRKKSFNDVETWVENSGYVTLAEIVLKALWRNGSVKIAGVLGTLKQGSQSAGNPSVPATPAPTDPPKP